MAISNPFELISLNGDNGFSIFNDQPDNASANAGRNVSSAGDINGDGIDDLIIGTDGVRPELEFVRGDSSTYYSPATGTSYVVFGRDDGFSSDLNLAELDGSDGFALSGTVDLYANPHLVSDSGDFNGDGIDDVLVSSSYYRFRVEQSYVIFGRQDGFPADLDLLNLTPEEGVNVSEELFGSLNLGAGSSLNNLGDINGDGLGDINLTRRTNVTENYVIFGTQSGLDISQLDGTNGFEITSSFDQINSAGDFNGDGIDDFIGRNFNDEDVHIVFGRDNNGFAASLDFNNLDSSSGLTINAFDSTQMSFANELEADGVGDLNNDGIDDVVVSTSFAEVQFGESEGTAHVIFGSNNEQDFNGSFNLDDIDGTNGFRITGFDLNRASGQPSISFSGAGDFNGDGVEDLIIEASFLSINGEMSIGAAYVIFGREGGFQEDIDISDIDGTNGFLITNTFFNEFTGEVDTSPNGFVVSGAGDINNDGVDDIILGNGNGSNSFVIFGQADQTVIDPQPEPQPPLNFDSRIFLTEGADEIALGGDNQVVFGLEGDDVIDFRNDNGVNRAFGGDGNDTFFLGSGDRIFGVDGDDTFIVGTGGGNVITGNRGDDQYIIANGVIPESANTITDFVTGDDLLVIQNLGASFADLSFRDSADGAIIALNGEDLVVLTNRNANFIGNADNFVFVDPTSDLPEFTQVFANDGDNNILATGSNEVFFGLGGDDVLDFRSDTGANRAFGGDGNDTFLLGSGDRVFGVDGNDRFFLGSGGGNVITGNRGADQYIIDGVIPESSNTITDFVVGDDLLVIQGVGASFGDLSFRDSDDGAIVALNGNDLAVLTNRNADFIANENNFDFVA